MKKLIIYFIVIGIALGIMLFVLPEDIFIKDIPINEITTENSSEFPFKEYKSMLEDISNNKFKYTYDVLINNNKYTYEGFRDGDNDKGIFKDGNIVEEYIELNEYIDKDLVDINNLLGMINDIDYKKDTYNETRMYTYNTKYDDLDTEIIIYTDLKNITKISISNMKYQYTLKYEDINE